MVFEDICATGDYSHLHSVHKTFTQSLTLLLNIHFKATCTLNVPGRRITRSIIVFLSIECFGITMTGDIIMFLSILKTRQNMANNTLTTTLKEYSQIQKLY